MNKTLLVISFVTILLSGCASKVVTDISTFRNESINLTHGTIKVVAANKSKGESLEFRFYKKKLEQSLVANHYRIDEQTPEYIATLDYSVREMEKNYRNGKVYWRSGVGFAHKSRYGDVIVSDISDVYNMYSRKVLLRIDRNTDTTSDNYDGKILQIEAISEGKCGHLTTVYDEMLSAIFSRLDRPDGSLDRVAVKGVTRCS